MLLYAFSFSFLFLFQYSKFYPRKKLNKINIFLFDSSFRKNIIIHYKINIIAYIQNKCKYISKFSLIQLNFAILIKFFKINFFFTKIENAFETFLCNKFKKSFFLYFKYSVFQIFWKLLYFFNVVKFFITIFCVLRNTANCKEN